MKDLFKYLSLAAGGYLALRTIGVFKADNTLETTIRGWFGEETAATPGGAPAGSGGGSGNGSGGGTSTPPALPPAGGQAQIGTGLDEPPVTGGGAVDPNAAAIVALVGSGVSEQLAGQWIRKQVSRDDVTKSAAAGNAEAIRLADVVGIKFNPDQWNYFRNAAGKGQVTIDLVDPSVRGTAISAGEYHQLLTAAGLAGLTLGVLRGRWR